MGLCTSESISNLKSKVVKLRYITKKLKICKKNVSVPEKVVLKGVRRIITTPGKGRYGSNPHFESVLQTFFINKIFSIIF